MVFGCLVVGNREQLIFRKSCCLIIVCLISFWSCDKPESTYQHVSDALSKELKIDPFFIREFLFDSKSYPLFNRAKVIEQNKKEFIIVPDKKGHAIDFYNSHHSS